MADMSDDPKVLLARAAQLKLFIMLRRTHEPARVPLMLSAHLRWMIGAERAGQIVMSGPVLPHEGATPLDGLTIIRAGSLAEAATLAQTDPFVAEGIVAFELCEWTVNEGALTVTLTISDSTVSFR